MSVYVSVDGTDCAVQEPSVFDPMWFSHKINGAGVRYEIGLSVAGEIVWVNGPFPCGKYPDIKIFKNSMVQALREEECLIADNGYNHQKCITPNTVSDDNRKLHSRIRARHETVNRRLKIFSILRQVYRHPLDDHWLYFHAVAQIVALTIKETNPLFAL